MHDPDLLRDVFGQQADAMRSRWAFFFYVAVPVAILALVMYVLVFQLPTTNVFVRLGAGSGALATVLLCYWLWLDRTPELVDCPDWLRICVTCCGSASLFLLAFGALMP